MGDELEANVKFFVVLSVKESSSVGAAVKNDVEQMKMVAEELGYRVNNKIKKNKVLIKFKNIKKKIVKKVKKYIRVFVVKSGNKRSTLQAAEQLIEKIKENVGTLVAPIKKMGQKLKMADEKFVDEVKARIKFFVELSGNESSTKEAGEKFIDKIKKNVGTLVTPLLYGVKEITTAGQQIVDKVKAKVKSFVELSGNENSIIKTGEKFDKIKRDVVDKVEKEVEILLAPMKAGQGIVDKVKEKVGILLKDVKDKVEKEVEILLKPVKGDFNETKRAGQRVVDKVKKKVGILFEDVKDKVEKEVEILLKPVKGDFNETKRVGQGVVDKVKKKGKS